MRGSNFGSICVIYAACAGSNVAAVLDLPLVDFEHQLAIAFMEMERKGLHVDRDYVTGYLEPTLTRRHDEALEICQSYGLEKMGSPKRGDILNDLGAGLTITNSKGYKVDKEILDAVIAKGGEPAILAQAIKDGTTASKFKNTYAVHVLESLDADDRCHPSHKPLQARTARTAVSGPALHQLPSRHGNRWEIRRMFDAKPGHSIIAADFNQIELVVIAAIANDAVMLQAIRDGVDLHQLTADTAGVERPVGKETNFLVGYGGGAKRLAARTGIEVTVADRTIKAFWRKYRGINRLKRKIIDDYHRGRTSVITPTGRHLPISRWAVYAGLNYLVQSTARDVLGQAVINLKEAGLWQYVIHTIHDEVLAEVPTAQAVAIGEQIAEIMTVRNFLGKEVDITAGASKPVPTWGHLYLDKGERMPA